MGCSAPLSAVCGCLFICTLVLGLEKSSCREASLISWDWGGLLPWPPIAFVPLSCAVQVTWCRDYSLTDQSSHTGGWRAGAITFKTLCNTLISHKMHVCWMNERNTASCPCSMNCSLVDLSPMTRPLRIYAELQMYRTVLLVPAAANMLLDGVCLQRDCLRRGVSEWT